MDGKEMMNGICKECVWMDSNPVDCSIRAFLFCSDSLQNPNNGVIKMDDIEKIPLTHAKERSDDWKAAYMSVGIALIFFGSCSLIYSHEGSNTTQNFVVPIYRFHFHSPC